MASISKEIVINASASDAWDVIGDFPAGPSRMAPGFVVNTREDADTRIVTFANGAVARERFISADGDSRRIVYTVIGDSLRPTHDNASMQVIADGEDRCRLVWIHDVLPDDLAPSLDAAMNQGLAVIKQTLEYQAGRTAPTSLEALKPGRMQGHGGTAKVSG